MEALKISHLVDYTPDSNDPIATPEIMCRLLAKALIAMAAKVDVLTAKLNADAGVTDVDYAEDFETVVTATEYTGA